MHAANLLFVVCLGLFVLRPRVCGHDLENESLPAPHSENSKRPLVRRPDGSRFKTVLSVDVGGIRGLFSAVVLIEVEQAVKRYILRNPHLLPDDAGIDSVDDFDIDLVDYFDCMAGASTGSWISFLLASRGGKGAFRSFLDRPEIVERYGVVRESSAEALRVFFLELGSVIYPPEAVDLNAGIPFDLTNPSAPGVAQPLFPVEGLQRALEIALGDTTLDDLETSVIVPAFDMMTGFVIFFARNAFRDPPVSTSAVASWRTSPRPSANGISSFTPDLTFDKELNYFLRDVGTASGTPPTISAAFTVQSTSNNETKFLLADSVGIVESPVLAGTLFTSSESGVSGFDQIAVLSLGNGVTTQDFTALSNAGAGEWFSGFTLPRHYLFGGQETGISMLDYLFYSNPNVRPNQFLRIQNSAPITTEEGLAFAQISELSFVGFIEQRAQQVARDYRDSIDCFVSEFVFGEGS